MENSVDPDQMASAVFSKQDKSWFSRTRGNPMPCVHYKLTPQSFVPTFDDIVDAEAS